MRLFNPLLIALLLAISACGERSAEPDGPQKSLLKSKDREFVSATLGDLTEKVRLILFTSPEDCEYCELTESFIGDVAALAPMVEAEVLSVVEHSALAEEYGVDRTPGIAIIGKKDFGIRYYGLPTGFEFTTFVEAIRQVGEEDPGLERETVQLLAKLEKPVTLTVFATKT